MDNLVLIRVAAALDASLRGAVLRDLREEAPARFRLVFEAARGPRSVLISLRAERPWIGRPAARLRPPPGSMGTPFPALARRCLVGAVVRAVAKPGADRVLRMSFAEGHALVVELATHGANLLLLGADDRILALARRPRASAGRLAPEAVYRPPDLPARAFLPHGRDADGIDRYLLERARDGESQLEVLRRHVFGVGTEGARLVLAEARASGRSPGEVLADRLARLERGELDPVIDGPLDLLEVVRQGGFDPGQCRLLPWEPPLPEGHATPYLRTDDPAATAGLYHEAFEAWTLLGERRAALRAVLSRERERMAAAERKARGDLDSFQDPERYRRWGEALLAGLGRARRDGGIVLVPDPYDAGGAPLAVPAAPEKSLTQAAADCFRAHRRARRGIDQAARRVREVGARRVRLEALEVQIQDARSELDLDRAERSMRGQGIPIGLGGRVIARAPRRAARPRLEGVRVFRTSEGSTVLAGRSARDNQRLTFALAEAEDFWFHAADRRGAHVVLRNDERARRPSPASLHEAAAIAAWFSEGRAEALVDVRWTRRKYVRRARGAPAGTVLLKRFESLRVRPAPPRTDFDPSPTDPENLPG